PCLPHRWGLRERQPSDGSRASSARSCVLELPWSGPSEFKIIPPSGDGPEITSLMGIGAVYKLLAGFWQHESAWLMSMKLGIGCRTRGRRQPISFPGQKRGGTAPRG